MRKVLFILFCITLAFLIFGSMVFLSTRSKEKGALQVTSNPESSVYLNDKLVGKTPLCLCEGNKMVDTGDYTIKLIPSKGDFEPFQSKITITKKVLTVVDRSFAQTALSEATIVTLSEISDKKQAQISVVSFPEGSQVFLDSNLSGTAPVLLKNVTQSDHEIKISKAGYKDKVIRIRTVFGYRLEAIVYLGIDQSQIKKQETPVASPSAALKKESVLILQTPTGFLRVREKPSTGGTEIGRVAPGETYELLDEQNGWYQIKLKNGNTGWISSQYAKKQS